jgi:pyruvate/2-oxoglutarate/acetoin dehydrogenase E1 component
MILRMNQAIARALADEMDIDPTVIVMGEDVAAAGGVFKATEGLMERFGPQRVRDTPISEMGFLGAGVGAAATGLRPVVEVMFAEFLGVALDQLTTQAALQHYLSAGAVKIPLVVRASCGAGLGFGAQHSQTLERWFLGTPGLRIAVPSGSRTAYGLMRSAIRDDNPVLLLEPRALYGARQEFVPSEEELIPLGVSAVIESGHDVTVVALGQMVGIVERAMSQYARSSIELIDLQTLMPWDRDAVMESVAKTGRLAIVEENQFTGGWGTEIAAYVAGAGFSLLRAPIIRVTAPDVPVPYASELEQRYVPTPAYVAAQVDYLVATGEMPEAWWAEEST